MMLADIATPPPQYLFYWLGSLATIFILFNQGAKVWDRFRGEAPKPSNPELSLVQQNLHSRVNSLEENVDAVRAQTAREREADRLSASARSAGIYKKIDEVSEKMNTKMDAMERRLSDKQERLVERLILRRPTDQ